MSENWHINFTKNQGFNYVSPIIIHRCVIIVGDIIIVCSFYQSSQGDWRQNPITTDLVPPLVFTDSIMAGSDAPGSWSFTLFRQDKIREEMSNPFTFFVLLRFPLLQF
jgi:hypothetical protein